MEEDSFFITNLLEFLNSSDDNSSEVEEYIDDEEFFPVGYSDDEEDNEADSKEYCEGDYFLYC